MEWTPPHIMSDSQRIHTHAAPADPARQDLGAPLSMFLVQLESCDTHCQDFSGSFPVGLCCNACLSWHKA